MLHNLIQSGQMSHHLSQTRAVNYLVTFSIIGVAESCGVTVSRWEQVRCIYTGVCRPLKTERSHVPLVRLLKLLNMNLIGVLSGLSLLLAAAVAQDPKPCGEYGTHADHRVFLCCYYGVKFWLIVFYHQIVIECNKVYLFRYHPVLFFLLLLVIYINIYFLQFYTSTPPRFGCKYCSFYLPHLFDNFSWFFKGSTLH